MIILHTEMKQLRNKTIDIFLLANNYHSIAGCDIEEDNTNYLLKKIYSDYDMKVIQALVKNHWITSEEDVSKFSLSSIVDIDKAHEIAILCLNSREAIKKKYRT